MKLIKLLLGVLIPLQVFALQLQELEPFSWKDIVDVPAPTSSAKGGQVLHFRASVKDYRNDPLAIEFVNTHMTDAKPLTSDADTVRFGVDAVTINGSFVELGFCTGRSINFIAALKPSQTIYGFDSFEGVAQDWDKGYVKIRKGTFKVIDQNFVPSVLNNVKLYKGWFSDVLPKFVKEILGKTPIAFLHVDCEVYSSTHEAFLALQNNIVPGTIIVFDEFYNYPEFAKHEYKAFLEMLSARKLHAKYLAYNVNHEQVVVQVID